MKKKLMFVNLTQQNCWVAYYLLFRPYNLLTLNFNDTYKRFYNPTNAKFIPIIKKALTIDMKDL